MTDTIITTDKTEEHDFGPNRPRPIIQTKDGFKVDTSEPKPAIIEAAARALTEFRQAFVVAVGDKSPFAKQALLRADAAIAALPLIKAATLEKAAKVAEGYPIYAAPEAPRNIAAAIRALKQEAGE